MKNTIKKTGIIAAVIFFASTFYASAQSKNTAIFDPGMMFLEGLSFYETGQMEKAVETFGTVVDRSSKTGGGEYLEKAREYHKILSDYLEDTTGIRCAYEIEKESEEEYNVYFDTLNKPYPDKVDIDFILTEIIPGYPEAIIIEDIIS